MARVFATPAEFRTWAGDDVALPSQRDLQSASLLVAQWSRRAWYDVDGDGLPTDSALRGALRDATCAVVLARQPAGASGALAAAGLKSATLGDATYSVADNAGDSGSSPDDLPGEAWRILAAAGLTGGVVVIDG